MSGSAYAWVGTEAGEQGSLVLAMSSRLQNSAPVSTLIGGSMQDMNASCASRLQAKLHFPLLLSLSIPEDMLVLDHVERTLLEKLSHSV